MTHRHFSRTLRRSIMSELPLSSETDSIAELSAMLVPSFSAVDPSTSFENFAECHEHVLAHSCSRDSPQGLRL